MSVPARPTPDQLRSWGIDPTWSQTLDVPTSHTGPDRGSHVWHVLDRSPKPGSVGASPITLLCVHGNPTWSYLWRSVVERLGDRYRVVAVDQLGMGFSERPEPHTGPRTFATRVTDLGDVVDALGITGPVVVLAHDWGGPISLGWVLAHRDQVRGVVLCNTGVAVPDGRRAPGIIRFAASGPITSLVGHRTRTFVDGTLALSWSRIARSARAGYRAPYRRAADRVAIAEFVGDIPLRPNHVSAAPIAEVAEGIRTLDVPVLLAWGGRDPVFDDDFAMDLASRMPHADLHRVATAGHLVVEESDIAGVIDTWLSDRMTTGAAAALPASPATPVVSNTYRPVWAALTERSSDQSVAVVDGGTGVSTSFSSLNGDIERVAAGLIELGLRPGDRVAMLTEPGIDLVIAVYGVWRAGGVTVIADRGLGLGGLRQAVRGAQVHWVIGPPKALAAARLLRWAPRATAIAVHYRRVLGAVATLHELIGSDAPPARLPSPDDPAAVVYTSGATGPAKGVRYLHRQLAAQRDALADTYAIAPTDRLVAAFAPFALYGPALGIASTIPDVDVTAPGSLTAEALAAACAAVEATVVFASPAALANVVRTASGPDPRWSGVRLALSAGAPVPIATLRAVATLMPAAELHTPYGMTECLPVADVELTEREQALQVSDVTGGAGSPRGVCVGHPVPGASVIIAPLGFDAKDPVESVDVGVAGEVLVRAPWCSEGYDHLFRTQRDARPHDRSGSVWHRTGDVGQLDAEGRLWIDGRTVHVVHAVGGPIAPVPVEVAVEQLEGIARAAAVGVGPDGCQQLVVIVEDPDSDDGLAATALTSNVREVVLAAVRVPVAAVLTVTALPVDIRHNTKIDRTALAGWAASVLAGDRARAPK